MLGLAHHSSPDVVRALAQLGIGVGVSVAVYGLGNLHFRSIFSYLLWKPGREGWRLDFAPSEIGWADRAFLVVFGVLNKAVRGLFTSRLNIGRKETIELPRLDIRCAVKVAAEQVELYDEALMHGQGGGGARDVDEDGMAGKFFGHCVCTLSNDLLSNDLLSNDLLCVDQPSIADLGKRISTRGLQRRLLRSDRNNAQRTTYTLCYFGDSTTADVVPRSDNPTQPCKNRNHTCHGRQSGTSSPEASEGWVDDRVSL